MMIGSAGRSWCKNKTTNEEENPYMFPGRRKVARSGVIKDDFTPSMETERRPSFSAAATGYLEKKAAKAPYRWQKRYFLGTGKYLRYYESEACSKLLAVIDLTGAEIEEEGKRILDIVTSAGSTIPLRASNEEQRDEWVAALTILRQALDRELSRSSTKSVEEVLPINNARSNPVIAEHMTVPSLGTRQATVTKVHDRSQEIRESMIATPRESFAAAAAGFLHKKASSKFTGWQPRFFVACHHYLRYYTSDEAGAELLGVIDLCGVAVLGQGIDDTPSQSREFVLKLADAEIHLRAATPIECAQWVSSLIEMQHQFTARPIEDNSNNNSTNTNIPRPPSRTFDSSNTFNQRRRCCGLSAFF